MSNKRYQRQEKRRSRRFDCDQQEYSWQQKTKYDDNETYSSREDYFYHNNEIYDRKRNYFFNENGGTFSDSELVPDKHDWKEFCEDFADDFDAKWNHRKENNSRSKHHPSRPNLRYPAAPQQNYSSEAQNYSTSYRYNPPQRYDSWNYQPRYPVRNTDFYYSRWDNQHDNSSVHKRSTDSRSDSSKNHSLSDPSENLSETVTKEIDQKNLTPKYNVSKNIEKNEGNRKNKYDTEAHYSERRARKRESNRLGRSRRAELRNRDISTLRKLPSSKKLKLVASTSIGKNTAEINSKESMCHNDRNDNIDSVAKATSSNDTGISVEKITDSAKIGDSCSEIMNELNRLINIGQTDDQKENNMDADCSNNSMEMEDDVIMIQPEVPTVDITDNDVEDISLYRNPEAPVPSIKVECDDTRTNPSVNQPTPKLALDDGLTPLNTRLSYLDCFTTIFDYTEQVNRGTSVSESLTEPISSENDSYHEQDVSKQLSFNETVSDQSDATEKICDVELLADTQIEKVNENLLSTETEDSIPFVKRYSSRSKSLSALRENNANITKFKSLRDLRTVQINSSWLVPPIREKEIPHPVSTSSKQDDEDVNMVNNHYTDELYWLLCVSANCTAGSDNAIVKEEDIETEPNDSLLNNDNTTLDRSILDKPSQESNSFNEVISSDTQTIGETVIKPVKDIKMKRKFEEDTQENNNVQSSKIRKKSRHMDTFKPSKKRKRIKDFDDSSSDNESLTNTIPLKTEQKVKETKVKSSTHHEAKLSNSTTALHTTIKIISKEEMKIRKKTSENKSTSTHKIVSSRSSSKYPTNKNVDSIKRREKIKQLFGELSDDEEESLTNPDTCRKQEIKQKACSDKLQPSHRKNKEKKLPLKSNSTSSNPNKVQKESRKSRVSHTSDVKSKSRSTSKERVSNIVRSDSSKKSRRSSISHKKVNSKHSFSEEEDHGHTKSVAESHNLDKETTRKPEAIREKFKSKSNGFHSKTALSKGTHLAPDIVCKIPEVLLPLCEATAVEYDFIKLQDCETFEVVNPEVTVISKTVVDVCTDRCVVAEAPEVKTYYQTVKQDNVVAVESDKPVIDLTEDETPTKATGNWSGEEDLRKLLMNSKNNGQTITIYRADESDSNTKRVEAVNLSLDYDGRSTQKVTVTDKNPNLNKDMQKNLAVSHICETSLPQSSAAYNVSEATLPQVNISSSPASIATQQVPNPNNLPLAPNYHNVTSTRQLSVNVMPLQQPTSFQSAALPNNQKQPPPLLRRPLDLMSYQINQIPMNMLNEILSIKDRQKIVEILTRHVYFLVHFSHAQKMCMLSLSQCLHYRNYFQTELTFFEDQLMVRLQSQSLQMFRELMSLKIQATRDLKRNVILIIENLTISLESKDMPKQVTRSMVVLLLWKLLSFKVELYMKTPLFHFLVDYCNSTTNYIKLKISGEQQHKTSSQSLSVNYSLPPGVSSNIANQDYQQSTSSQTKPISDNPSRDQLLSAKPVAFRRLTLPEYASNHSQATQTAPPMPTGLGNIRNPSPKNVHNPNSNQMSLSLTSSSVTYTNSSASHNTFQRPSTLPPPEYNSISNTSFSTTTDSGSSNQKFPSISRLENSAPAEPTYQLSNYYPSSLLSELLRVKNGETHSSLNKNVMVNLPFTKPQPYVPKSSSVSTNVEKPNCRINIIQNQVITSKNNTTSNVASSAELFKNVRGQALVQTETRPNQYASREGTSTENLSGSTTRGPLDHLYIAESRINSDSQNMTFHNVASSSELFKTSRGPPSFQTGTRQNLLTSNEETSALNLTGSTIRGAQDNLYVAKSKDNSDGDSTIFYNIASSSELFKNLPDPPSVQTGTRQNLLASNEETSALNLTGSTIRGTQDHFQVANSKDNSGSQNMTFHNVASSSELFKTSRGPPSFQTGTRQNLLTSNEETSALNLTGSTIRGAQDNLYVAKSKDNSDGDSTIFYNIASSSELFKNLPGLPSVQTETIQKLHASNEETSALNLTGSTIIGTQDHLQVAKSKINSDSQNMTFHNIASSSELFKNLRGPASVQTGTKQNLLASSEETAALNLTGSTISGTQDYLNVAKSEDNSDSQNMTFKNSQITGLVPPIPMTEVSYQNIASGSINSPSPKPLHRPDIPTVSTQSNMTLPPSTDAAIDIIDLTWVDDMNEADLKNDMDFVYVKQENVERNENSNSGGQQNRPMESPTDSGVESPGLQNEEEPTLIYVSRLCPCGLTASYTCACGDAWYCGQPCQLNDWPYHQRICHRANGTAVN